MPRLPWILALLGLLPVAALPQALPLSTYAVADLGIEVANYRYEETFNGYFFMANEGNKVGLNASFSQPLADGWFWGADARQSHGNVSYSSAASGSKGSNPDVVTEVRITGGQDHVVGAQVLAPYFGLGYRALYNDLRGRTTSGAAGYRRVSEYFYVPLGLTHRMRAGSQDRLSTSVEYDLLLEGRQQSNLSDIVPTPLDGCSNDPVNMQRAGHGLRLIVNYETIHWSVGTFFHYWNITDSDQALCMRNGIPNGLIMEPANTTREVGVTFKLRFR